MSLLRPTPGQCFDRLTVLDLKIEAFYKAGKPTRHLTLEREEILAIIVPQIPSVKSDFETLAEINKKLWHNENLVRSLNVNFQCELSIVAKQIASLNDQRIATIQSIDQKFGITNSEQKIFS